MLKYTILVLFAISVMAESSFKARINNDQDIQTTIAAPKDVNNGGVSMLELSTRPWLYSLSLKYGYNISRLQDVPDQELQAIANKKFDYLWMMGVWHLGWYGLNHDRTDPGLLNAYSQELPGYTMDDIIGSPYAVTNYTLNPELGSDSDLLAFKQKVNNMGLKLMLDFVPNHSAVDCPWTTTNIDYYIRAPKGTQPPYDPSTYLPSGIAYGSNCQGCGSWTDTAQFNYWNNDLRNARIQELLHVASVSDGIRCDMAFLLLNDVFQQTWSTQLSSWGYTRPSSEWWSDSISIVKQKYPNVIFLAEVYSPWQSDLQNVGFDYTYDKTLYDKLGNGDLDDIRGWITGNSVSFHTHSAHFISNHDEPRAAAYFGSWWRAAAASLVLYTMPGMRFNWMWEESGFTARLDVHLRRETTQQPVSAAQNFYNTFLPIVMDDVFKYGTWTYLNVGNSDSSWRLIAYRWEYNDQKRLVVVNYSDTEGEGTVIVSNAQPVQGNDTIPVTDLLSGTTYYRSANEMRTTGLTVLVNSWFAQIFEYN